MTGPPGFEQALHTFRRAAQHVPAYVDFLYGNGIDPGTVQCPEDFRQLPAMTKTNYLHKYPLNMLAWKGDITEADTWSTSSGSSGRPTYWPRGGVSLNQSVELHDRIFRHSFQSHQRSTLVVIAFAMGNWIGGTYTLSATQQLGERGHRVSVITPGINVATVLENIADLGPFYDQVVLVGYPPFVKDVLDQATSDVLGQDIRLLMAGENITEYWRDYVLKRLGKEGRAEETCLIYGTADAGMIGHETATTINLRRLARNDPELDSALFGGLPIQPTFVEYDPNYRFTETDDNGYLLFTSDSAIPLIRYRINDVGRVINAPELERMLDQSGHCSPVKTSTTDAGFISLGSRPDIAATFYALKIFPESIHSALEVDGIAEFVSGKFNLITQSDEAFEQTLALHVELKSDAGFDASLIPRLHGLVVEQLSRTNSEYRQLLQTLGKQAEPTIHLHPFGTDRFTHTIKNRWVGLS